MPSFKIYNFNLYILEIAFSSLILYGCTDVIDVDIDEGKEQLIVDAWINHKYDTQVIKLRRTQPYFDSSPPKVILGAVISVTDLTENRKVFFTDNKGIGDYIWMPPMPEDTFRIRSRLNSDDRSSGGFYNSQYRLDITLPEGSTYHSFTSIERSISIDSIRLERREKNIFQNKGIYAQLFARDISGLGDCYWIRSYKNNQFLNKSSEINLAYDAAFSAGSQTDGLYFIRPIREGINPVSIGDSNEEQSPYKGGDHIYIEVWSITEIAFLYMNFLEEQLNNQGLFAVPAANLFTNIISKNDDSPSAVGFFSGAGISHISITVPMNIEDIPFEER